MPRLIPIDALDRPELAPYLTLRRSDEQERTGLFVAEGPKVIERAFAAGLTVESMLCTEEWRAHFWSQLTAQATDLPVFVTDIKHLRLLIGFHLFNGALAAVRVPTPPALTALLAPAPRPRLWLAFDGLSSAENLGTIVRSAVALGVQAILCGETCASPWLRRAVRTSMGAMLAVPIHRSSNLAADLRACTAAGFRCLAADANHGTPAPDADLRGDICLVLGSEADGLRPHVAAACPGAVHIPMPGNVDSLNVAAAAAILLYEAARQRRC